MLITLMPFVYFLLMLYMVVSSTYFKRDNTPQVIISAAFVLKCISALYFGYIFQYNIVNGSDTFLYKENAEIVFSASKQSWWYYIQLVFGRNDYANAPSYLIPYINKMDFWYDTSNYFLVRINALIRLISFGNYYVHAIVFAFISFVGIYNIYLFFADKVVNKKLLQLILFGIPSIVFWTSGVHKEAIVVFALGIILYNLKFILEQNYTRKHIAYILLGLFILGNIRLYILSFLLPFILSLVVFINYRLETISWRKHLLITAIVMSSIIILTLFLQNINITQEFFIRREHFLHSVGSTSFTMSSDFNSILGILHIIFDAIINPFIHPFPNESNFILVLLASIETYTLLAIFISLIISLKLKTIDRNPYAVFCILFSLSIFFLIGLIVNNSGAIVRYRSIAIPFLLIGLLLLNQGNNKEGVVSKNIEPVY